MITECFYCKRKSAQVGMLRRVYIGKRQQARICKFCYHRRYGGLVARGSKYVPKSERKAYVTA